MKNLVLVKKYAQGLVQAMTDEAEFEAVRAELRLFLDLYAGHDELRKALLSPFINLRTKARILQDVLARTRAGGKTARFLSLLFEHKRLALLGDIVAFLPEMWNDKLGIITFEVASVIPLTAVQKSRLRETLEAAEGGPVSLVFKIDPAVVGGLSLRRGHIVYDVSIQGNLDRLRELIQQG
ncbi:MAG: ATP synthase F1 subunit delta [Candidatus Aminicenantales bacterium]|jgi:F-type H+-transporting ATPase subunit delta